MNDSSECQNHLADSHPRAWITSSVTLLLLFSKRLNVDKVENKAATNSLLYTRNLASSPQHHNIKTLLASLPKYPVQKAHSTTQKQQNTRTNRQRPQKGTCSFSPPTQAMPRKRPCPALHPQTGSACLQLAYLPGLRACLHAQIGPNMQHHLQVCS